MNAGTPILAYDGTGDDSQSPRKRPDDETGADYLVKTSRGFGNIFHRRVTMSRVILIDPAYDEKGNVRPQLGTLQLAGMLLREGFDPVLLDFSVLKKDASAALNEAMQGNVLFVGISTVVGSMLRGALNAAAAVRERNPIVPIVWGGVHPSLEPPTTLAHPLVDMIAVGDGEFSTVELAHRLKRGEDVTSIPGMGFLVDGKVRVNPQKQVFDIEDSPLPPYELVPLSRYHHDFQKRESFFGLKADFVLSYESSRGCPFSCSYCVNSIRKDPFRQKSSGKIVAELDHIITTYGADGIAIIDDNFFTRPDRAFETLRLMTAKKWNCQFYVAARADFIARCTDADFDLMKSAGMVMTSMGVESGSNRMLNILNKKEKAEVALAANEKLAKHGIYAWFHFLYGFARETLDDLLANCATMRAICEANPEYARVNLNQLIPNPGSPSFNDCMEYGWTPPDSIEKWADVLIHTRRLGKPPYVDQEVWDFSRAHLEGVLDFPRNSMPDFGGTIGGTVA